MKRLRTGPPETKDHVKCLQPCQNNGRVPNSYGHNNVLKSGVGPVANDRYNQSRSVRESGKLCAQGPVVCYNCNHPGHIASNCIWKDRLLIVGVAKDFGHLSFRSPAWWFWPHIIHFGSPTIICTFLYQVIKPTAKKC